MERDRTAWHIMSMLCNKYGKREINREKEREKMGEGAKDGGKGKQTIWRQGGNGEGIVGRKKKCGDGELEV